MLTAQTLPALLDAGADKSIETVQPPGHTALSMAQSAGHADVVALLQTKDRRSSLRQSSLIQKLSETD